MKKFLLPLALMLLGATCQQDPDHPKPPPPSDSSWCQAAEERMTKLRRASGGPCLELKNPDGRPFTEICKEVHANGQNLHPECIATNPNVKTCEDISPVCQWGKTP